MNPRKKLKAETKEATDLLAQIGVFIVILESEKSPNWATVGDASRLRYELQEIVRWTRNLE